MKRFILAMFSIAMCATACSSDDSDINQEGETLDLLGAWVFTQVNNVDVVTNEYFVCYLREDGIQEYLQWVDIDGVNSTLIYKNATTYTVEGSILTLDSDLNNDHIVIDVTLDGDNINWLEVEKIVDNVDYYMGYTYQGYLAQNDYSSQITQGTWEGRATEGRDESNPYLRIKYNDDSTYEFQYRMSEDEEWSDKVDNDGHYYLLGDLLGSVWINDVNTGTEGSNSETWIISIEGDTMVWQATREEEHFESFEFVRVE